MERLTVIKVGGKIVEDGQMLAQLLTDFAAVEGFKVLVHGGGRSATRLAAELGIESRMVGGRRVTDADMLRVVTMVYGGLVNKNIVAQLQARGINALGLTGADLNVLRSRRRPPVPVAGGEDGPDADRMVDYGFVGDVEACDGRMLTRLIEAGAVPVMAPLTHDGEGHILNTNADTIAAETAKGLAPYFDVTLMYCFEKPGVLRNEHDDDSVIPHIKAADFGQLKAEGIISGGMIPKIENALSACRAGVGRVVITRADCIGRKGGTVITVD